MGGAIFFPFAVLEITETTNRTYVRNSVNTTIDTDRNQKTGLNSFIESSPMDIGDGDSFTLVRKLVPDITFRGSTTTDSIVNAVSYTHLTLPTKA